MNYLFPLGMLFVVSPLFAAAPPRDIPAKLLSEFTWNGEIPVSSWYIDETEDSATPKVYLREDVDNFVNMANRRTFLYYGRTDQYLYNALSQFPIEGKDVAIIGSGTPWYEAIVLSFGGKPITIEYNKRLTDHPELTLMTVAEYEENPRTFDVILSISSLEHDGLGRYGDPINPNGDIQWMSKARGMLRENGVLILAVPVGKDSLFWNAHRQYGEKRLNRIFEGWERLASFGFSPSDLEIGGYTAHQPVFVLRPLE